jgi:hypothetical protein
LKKHLGCSFSSEGQIGLANVWDVEKSYPAVSEENVRSSEVIEGETALWDRSGSSYGLEKSG